MWHRPMNWPGKFRIDEVFSDEEWADKYHSVETTHVRASSGETMEVRGDLNWSVYWWPITRLVHQMRVMLDRCGRVPYMSIWGRRLVRTRLITIRPKLILSGSGGLPVASWQSARLRWAWRQRPPGGGKWNKSIVGIDWPSADGRWLGSWPGLGFMKRDHCVIMKTDCCKCLGRRNWKG